MKPPNEKGGPGSPPSFETDKILRKCSSKLTSSQATRREQLLQIITDGGAASEDNREAAEHDLALEGNS
jgi:hypothetical protein